MVESYSFVIFYWVVVVLSCSNYKLAAFRMFYDILSILLDVWHSDAIIWTLT